MAQNGITIVEDGVGIVVVLGKRIRNERLITFYHKHSENRYVFV